MSNISVITSHSASPSLPGLENISSIIAGYVGNEEYHKELLIKEQVEKGVLETYRLEMPFYFQLAQERTTHMLQANNQELAIAFKERKSERQLYVEFMRTTLKGTLEKVRKIYEYASAIFFAPSCLEKSVIASIARDFKIRLISKDLMHLRKNIENIPEIVRKNNITLLERDLSGDLWAVLGPIFLEIEYAIQLDNTKPGLFKKAFQKGLDNLLRIYTTYSPEVPYKEYASFGGKADCVISLNVPTDVTHIVEGAVRMQFQLIAKQAFSKGVPNDPEIEKKLEAFWFQVSEVRNKLILRHFSLLTSCVKPGGRLLFADTTTSVIFDREPTHVISKDENKIPPSVLKLIRNWKRVTLQEEKTVFWPIKLSHFENNPNWGLGYEVKVFSFKKDFPSHLGFLTKQDLAHISALNTTLHRQ